MSLFCMRCPIRSGMTALSSSAWLPCHHRHDEVSLPAWPAISYLLSAVATSTAQATVQPTIGLLPIPMNPIISMCAGTDDKPIAIKLVCNRQSRWSECVRIAEVQRRKSQQGLTDEEPANWATECIWLIVSVIPPDLQTKLQPYPFNRVNIIALYLKTNSLSINKWTKIYEVAAWCPLHISKCKISLKFA